MSNQPKTYILSGGEDYVTPPLQIPEGMCREATNYEQNYETGYSRINGYRKLVNADITGSGPIRGIVVYDDSIYVFRDDLSGTTCKMWKATPAEYRIGSQASGDAESLWGKNIVVDNGSWTEITDIVDASDVATTLTAGGYYEFVIHNFKATGASTTTTPAGSHDVSGSSGYLYGVDGKNPAWFFNGTQLKLIDSTYTPDVPQHIAANANHLVLGFRAGEIAVSAVGDPTEFSTGASSYGVTDYLTGMSATADGALIVFTRDKTYILYNMADPNSVILKKHSKTVGAYPYTIQALAGTTMFYDNWGLTDIQSSNKFGDIITSSLSAKIQTQLTSRQPQTSVILKSKSQYRLYTTAVNGVETDCMIGTLIQGKSLGFTHASYPFVVACAESGFINLTEYSLTGSSTGTVYHMDVGNSFDGAAYLSRLKLPFNFIGTPAYEKQFKKMVLNVGTDEAASLNFAITYNSGRVGEPRFSDSTSVTPEGPEWGEDIWGSFYWGAGESGYLEKHLKGHAKNLSITFTNTSASEAPHTLRDISFIYELRRIEH